jgi:hypothetical protein
MHLRSFEFRLSVRIKVHTHKRLIPLLKFQLIHFFKKGNSLALTTGHGEDKEMKDGNVA